MNESIKLTDRPTPETDAEVKRTYQGVGLIHIVNAEYARRLEQQRDAVVEALQKINVIRNSIVAHQSCNFSEHVYPLVAALNEAGIEGMPYPAALAYFGPTTERAAKAEAERDELRREVAVLKAQRT